jgi:hypothetical protein
MKINSSEHKRTIRKGYLGHITKIAKTLNLLAEKDKDIKENLESNSRKKF